MSEDQELQNKIAQLAGRINRYKSATSPTPPTYQHVSTNTHGTGHLGWSPRRGTPYGNPRGRSGRGRANIHRNRTLIVNNQDASRKKPDAMLDENVANENGAPSGWVSKRDRHMQLINNAVFEQKSQERTRAIEETKKQRAQERQEREKAKLGNYFQTVVKSQYHGPSTHSSQPLPQIVISDIQFYVADGGSKLVKAKDEQNMLKGTPKRINVGGVMFFRSKHGNLYRAGLVKTSRRAIRKSDELCPHFNNTGACSNGPNCRYVHDVNKVAICKDYLLTGKCHAGENCDLSHDPTSERVPACLHFQRGKCNNPDCRYTHVRTNPAAPVCKAFASLGYCSNGTTCAERHTHECPDYTNKGFCRNNRCRLPHVDRAGQLRKSATAQIGEEEDDTSFDVSSDEELAGYGSEDFDSDDVDDDIMMQSSHLNNRELSQQVDFVSF